MQVNRFIRDSNSLPLGPIAHELLRGRFELLSDAEMAQVEFGPWKLADSCEVPTEKQWEIAHPEALRALTVAAQIVCNDKAQLVEKTAALEEERLDQLMGAIDRWAHLFRMHLAMLEAAQDRIIVALAVLSEAEL